MGGGEEAYTAALRCRVDRILIIEVSGSVGVAIPQLSFPRPPTTHIFLGHPL